MYFRINTEFHKKKIPKIREAVRCFKIQHCHKCTAPWKIHKVIKCNNSVVIFHAVYNHISTFNLDSKWDQRLTLFASASQFRKCSDKQADIYILILKTAVILTPCLPRRCWKWSADQSRSSPPSTAGIKKRHRSVEVTEGSRVDKMPSKQLLSFAHTPYNNFILIN